MATPLTASGMLVALKAEGCRVVEYKSWRTHNRNHKGPWGPVHGVMIHHTVTSGTEGSVALCYNGHSSLPGPLCHTVGAKDGTLYMVGNGRANHAGSGDDDVLRAVIDERALPADNEANTDGNRHFYGLELINLGNGKDPWPDEQIENAARWAAALCRAHGWGAESVIGHLEWQPGKVDPRGFTMTSFRARVARLLAHPPGHTSTTQQEDDMQLNDEVPVGQWIADRWPDDRGLQDGSILVRTALASGYAHSRAASENTRAILAQLAAQQTAIDKLVDALTQGTSFDAAALREEIRQAVASAVESVTVHLDVTEGA